MYFVKMSQKEKKTKSKSILLYTAKKINSPTKFPGDFYMWGAQVAEETMHVKVLALLG